MKIQLRTLVLLLIAMLALSVTVVAAQGDAEGDDMDSALSLIITADSATVSEEELVLDAVFGKVAALYDVAEEPYFTTFEYLAFEGAFTWEDAPNALDEVTLMIDSDQATYTLVAVPVVGEGTGEAEIITSTWEVSEFVAGAEYTEDGLVELDKVDVTELTNVTIYIALDGEALVNFTLNLEAWLDEFRADTVKPACVPRVSC